MRHPLFALGLLAASVASPATAQKQVDYDAVAIAPHSHEILLETEKIRVLRVSVAPGATEPVHEHRWPSVMYFEQPQPITYIGYELVDGMPVETSRIEVPTEAMSGAEAAGPEGLHAVQNRGAEPFLALRVEFKDGSGPE